MFRRSPHSPDPARTGLWRSRWAAIGAAVAVSLGAGGLMVAQAAPGPAESTIVSVTPERILDTRDPVNLGLAGPFVSPVSQKLKVTGSIPTATGTKTVVPAGATGVLLNVTAVGANANGFISVRPGDAAGTPTTSSLNFDAGSVVPNSVQVSMPTAGANAGQIDITFDAYGVAGRTTDILIDVVGYTTNIGLQQLVADVYTKAQVDAKFATTGRLTVGAASLTADNAFVNFTGGCSRQDNVPHRLVAGLQLPVGVTITKLTGQIIDSNAANGSLSLKRTTAVVSTIATVTTSTSSGGVQPRSVTLATPEVVDPNEVFYIEYTGGDGTASHQICGVEIEYTIPSGQSVLLTDSSDQNPADGPVSGSE